MSKIYNTQSSLGRNSISNDTSNDTGLLKSISGKSFNETLQQIRSKTKPESVEQKNSQVHFFDKVVQKTQKQLDSLIDHWNDISHTIPQNIAHLSKETRQFIEFQIRVNDIHQKTELFAKVGEAFSSSLRRVQQMGSG